MSISAGEILGLAMVLGLITGVAAGLLVPRLVERFRCRLLRHERLAATLEHWVSARLALSRAAKEYGDAFRSIEPHTDAGPPSEAVHRADQARTAWLSAQRQWEEATARLLVWSDDAHLGATLRRFEHPDALTIRTSIAKGDTEVARLHAQLDGLDRLALQIAQRVMHETPAWWWRRLSQGVRFVRSITHRWSRP